MTPKISPIVLNRIPNFVQEDYPGFVRFIKDYFEWLETDINFLSIVNSWRKNVEPSNNVDEYIDAILRDLGWYYKTELKVNKSTLLSCLRDFYLSRGSIQSFNFLFKALFNEDVRIAYPRERLLWLSQANYGTKTFIFVRSDQNANTEYFINNISELGGYIEGVDTKIKAFIEDIVPFKYSGGEYLRLEIQKPIGDFSVNEDVIITVGNLSENDAIIPVVDFIITEPGTLYSEGDRIIIEGATVTGNVIVSKVSAGGIDSLGIGPSQTPIDGTLITAPSREGGEGFYAVVEDGQIIVLSKGNGYKKIPKFSFSQEEFSILPESNSIGQILKIETKTPYLWRNTANMPTASISSENGNGATIQTFLRSTFTTGNWVDSIGFLGQRSNLVDSNKFQQFSYEVVSKVNPEKYSVIVDDLLHPVGFNRFDIVEVESSVDVSKQISNSFSHISYAVLNNNECFTGEQSDFNIRTSFTLAVTANQNGSSVEFNFITMPPFTNLSLNRFESGEEMMLYIENDLGINAFTGQEVFSNVFVPAKPPELQPIDDRVNF